MGEPACRSAPISNAPSFEFAQLACDPISAAHGSPLRRPDHRLLLLPPSTEAAALRPQHRLAAWATVARCRCSCCSSAPHCGPVLFFGDTTLLLLVHLSRVPNKAEAEVNLSLQTVNGQRGKDNNAEIHDFWIAEATLFVCSNLIYGRLLGGEECFLM